MEHVIKSLDDFNLNIGDLIEFKYVTSNYSYDIENIYVSGIIMYIRFFEYEKKSFFKNNYRITLLSDKEYDCYLFNTNLENIKLIQRLRSIRTKRNYNV